MLDIKDTILKIFDQAYFLIFRELPDDFAKRLVKNLSVALFGVGGSTLITFGFSVLAIRYLGPIEFGKWNLVGSIAEFFVILPLWGLTFASLRYLGAERENKGGIIGTSFRTVVALSLLFFLIYLISAPFLQSFLKIDNLLYYFALLYGLILIFFYLFQSFFQGLEKFKKLSFLWIISAFIFAGTISFYLFCLHDFSFKSLFWSNVWRSSLVIFAGTWIFRKSLFKFSRQVFCKLFPYGTFNMVSVFAGFFSLASLDNLMINYFLGTAAVGLYAAYYLAFGIFMGRVLNTFSQVFLPMASGFGDIEELFNRALMFIKKISVIILAGNFFLVWLLFKFYGKQFSFDWRLGLLMALSITLYSFLVILGNIIASIGVRGIRVGTVFSFSAAFLNVALNAILIPRFQLFGAVIATILVTLTIIVAAIYTLKVKLIKNEQYQKIN